MQSQRTNRIYAVASLLLLCVFLMPLWADGAESDDALAWKKATLESPEPDREAPIDLQIGLGEPPEPIRTLAFTGGGQYGSNFAGADFVLTSAELEAAITDHITLAGGLAYYRYRWTGQDSTFLSEREEGWGIGVRGETRIYPQRSLNGFYFGFGVAVFPVTSMKYEATDGFGVVEVSDSSNVAFAFFGLLGYVFATESGFLISPRLFLGSYSMSQAQASGVIGGIGLHIGLAF